MRLTITKTANVGQDPVLKCAIDGEEYSLKQVSRYLTLTSDESGNGVFETEDYTVKFCRGKATVWLQFRTIDLNDDLDTLIEAIKVRVAEVEEAFKYSYPACNDTRDCEF